MQGCQRSDHTPSMCMHAVYNYHVCTRTNQAHSCSEFNIYCPECSPGGTIVHPGQWRSVSVERPGTYNTLMAPGGGKGGGGGGGGGRVLSASGPGPIGGR